MVTSSAPSIRFAVGRRSRRAGGILIAVLFLLPPLMGESPHRVEPVREFSLEQCLSTAWERNRQRPASRFALAAAEAQLRQVLAGYWPRLSLQAGYELLDEYRNFVFPASTWTIPPQNVSVPAGVAFITVPAGVLGPAAVQLPVQTPAQTISSAPQQFAVPAQDVQLADRETIAGTLDLSWLLFDGGLRAGLRAQARGGVLAAQEQVRRTDLEIVESVTRFYYGAILARQLHRLGSETLERMETTLKLTESVYRTGSGTVTKSDYLSNQVMVESLRAMTATLAKNEALAQAALANVMGLPWQESVSPAERDIPYTPVPGDLAALAGQAYEFNPDWRALEAGLHAAEGAVLQARSGHAPQLALTGSLHRIENDYDKGYVSERNKRGWTIGLGLRLPLFDGHLTRERIVEARARLAALQEKKILLREGLGLQLRQIVLEIDAATRAHDASLAARRAAEEDRDLNTRAYFDQLVGTEKVVRAQLMEALMTAQHLKTRYDHAALQARLALLVGREVGHALATGPAPAP